ncbi:MAG: hypothetical protein ABI621_12480 [Chloroflexota bacterium]
MELNARDNEVINLLTKLKNANITYPQELLALRRQGYIKQVAEVSAGAGLAMALRSTRKGGNGVGGAPVASKLLEMLLVVAIVAEASTVAYFYRDELAELFRTSSNAPRVEEISSPPVIESPFPTFESTMSPVVTETTIKTETPIATPSFEFAAEATDQAGGVAVEATNQGSTAESSQTVSTPAPSDNTNDKSNNGNQYGLTPKPERTKEPAGEKKDNNSDTQTNPKKPK